MNLQEAFLSCLATCSGGLSTSLRKSHLHSQLFELYHRLGRHAYGCGDASHLVLAVDAPLHCSVSVPSCCEALHR